MYLSNHLTTIYETVATVCLAYIGNLCESCRPGPLVIILLVFHLKLTTYMYGYARIKTSHNMQQEPEYSHSFGVNRCISRFDMIGIWTRNLLCNAMDFSALSLSVTMQCWGRSEQGGDISETSCKRKTESTYLFCRISLFVTNF